MSESQNDPLRRMRDRFNNHVQSEETEIQDWINANGLLLGCVVAFIVVFAVYALVS